GRSLLILDPRRLDRRVKEFIVRIAYHDHFSYSPTMSMVIIPHLYYSWSGWPTEGAKFPPEPDAEWWNDLQTAYQPDKIKLMAKVWKEDSVQLTFSVDPDTSPVFFTARVKGRLQHALRAMGTPVAFSRKVAMRSLGKNDTTVVENYLRDQLEKESFVDLRYEQRLAAAAYENEALDLSLPRETNSGRYWYNLHLVATTIGRYRLSHPGLIGGMSGAMQVWARVHGHQLRSLAVMPDHLHFAIRGNIENSPSLIAETLWSALHRHMQGVVYSDRMYAGTFSEYSLHAVRGMFGRSGGG
ncbi:MAG TPA: hypothetical protein PKE55_15440, partial [Kiritimatiellia bacterium]|nr:hypothetical protein [Kiritimatiellia bacterium]